ncbi:hypothetical protein CABS03_01122 [Colletotrichum abscissum]|uniref:Uncharacterized protein n=1 Tax=Colletotrichum abscissum TaxID=1671311 RepID=A0A9P9X796_9PEZI|nr:hypothetical protein CABS02_11257 [Colletotrichum abscissum]
MWSFTTQNLVPTLLRSPIFSKPIQPFPAWLLSSRHISRLRSRPERADLPHPSTSSRLIFLPSSNSDPRIRGRVKMQERKKV